MMQCVKFVSYSILVNREPKGFGLFIWGILYSPRRLTLTPFFFYCVMKVYLVLSHKLIEMVLYEGFSLSKRNPILITHLLFANDTFLFCMINRNDCQKVLNILETYDRILSQQVNGIEEKFPSFSINLLLRIWRRKFKRCWELGSHRIFFLKKIKSFLRCVCKTIGS